MVANQCILNLEKEIEKLKNNLKDYRLNEKLSKNILRVGIGGLIYLGLRTFIGPDIDYVTQVDSMSALDVLDATAGIVGSIGSLFGGAFYLGDYIASKLEKRKLKKSELKLQEEVEFLKSIKNKL